MDLRLRGKSAVVTGASKGIGRSIALRLAEEGAAVAICARGEPALRETETELRARSVPVYAAVCDVGDPEALDGFLDAARANGVPMIISNQASVPMETIATALGDSPRWFQLYWSRSDDLVASFVRRAEACGCSAIVLTLDTTMLGWRPRDLDLASLPFMKGQGIAQYTSDPVFLSQLGRVFRAQATVSHYP